MAAAAVLYVAQNKSLCQQPASSTLYPPVPRDMRQFKVRRTMLAKNCQGFNLRDSPSTSGNGLAAGTALPDTNSSALYGVLAAECADVTGVLSDFHLLHLLSERGTVSVISPKSTFNLLPASSSEQELRFGIVCFDHRGEDCKNRT